LYEDYKDHGQHKAITAKSADNQAMESTVKNTSNNTAITDHGKKDANKTTQNISVKMESAAKLSCRE
jgi:hypothetical protein